MDLKWIHVDTATKAPVKQRQGYFRDFPDGFDPNGVSAYGPTEATMYLPVVQGTDDAYDPATQKLVPVKTGGVKGEHVDGEWVQRKEAASKDGGEIRQGERDTLGDGFKALPAHLRGPYWHLYRAVKELLDLGDTEAALEAIDNADPSGKIDGDPVKKAEFEQVRQALYDGVAALPEA